MPRRERRRRLADDLYSTLVDGHYTFWGHIHPLLLKRDITRHDVRQLVSLGLASTRGNYRALLKLFGMDESDYKRFMNFLAAHECTVDFRQFRTPPPMRACRSGADRAREGEAARPPGRVVSRPSSSTRLLANPAHPGPCAMSVTDPGRSPRGGVRLASRNRGCSAAARRSRRLILAPCNSIHTFFMRFPIDVAFVDRAGRIVQAPRTVRPWRLRHFGRSP